jgi:hypothetical protein
MLSPESLCLQECSPDESTNPQTNRALRVEETASSKPTRTPIRPHLRAERASPAERQAKRHFALGCLGRAVSGRDADQGSSHSVKRVEHAAVAGD